MRWQLCCEPHQSQQGRRTDLDMEEESLSSSDRNASHSKRSGPLDFDDSYILTMFFPRDTVAVVNQRFDYPSLPFYFKSGCYVEGRYDNRTC